MTSPPRNKLPTTPGFTQADPGTGLTRRSVVAGLVFAGGCFAGMNIRQALAEAASQGRPLLTEDSLAGMMQGKQRATFNPALARAMRSDLAGFLGRHFALTDRQLREIHSIPEDQLARAGEAISANEAAGGTVELVFGKGGYEAARLELEALALRGGGLRIQVRDVAR
jgi:hypothetical protein